MKKRYELQYQGATKNDWVLSSQNRVKKSLKSKIAHAEYMNGEIIGIVMIYRVVQKLGRKVIKVVYPKGK